MRDELKSALIALGYNVLLAVMVYLWFVGGTLYAQIGELELHLQLREQQIF